MGKYDFRCPRCNSKDIIDLEDNIQCSNCHEEFSKKDLIRVTKDKILSISEKKEFLKILTDDNENTR